jgi:hypothetical protein
MPRLRVTPDFIIGGAPRCATSFLAERMRDHPQICMSAAKEPWYFVVSADSVGFRRLLRIRTRGYHHRGAGWYEKQFAKCAPEQVRGEASVGYMYHEESAGMIRDATPDVMLIFQLRDPVERIISQYLFDLRYWRLPPLGVMVASGDERLRLWVSESLYAKHLERFYDLFPRDNILVLFLEDMQSDPAKAFEQIFEFVGVDRGFVPARLSSRENETRLSRSRVVAQLLRSRPLPFPRIQERWDRFADVVVRYNSKPSDVAVGEDVRRALWDLVGEDFARLPDVIGRPVPISR